jgi:aminoglycoside/choline kinase family phosphotransferase
MVSIMQKAVVPPIAEGSTKVVPRPGLAVHWPDADRQRAFERWFAPLAQIHALDAKTLTLASADASFRRYLRVAGADSTRIVMDAPPPQEDVRPFVDMARRIAAAGLNAPQVLAADTERGFLLLSDLGTTPYLVALADATPQRADALMRDAIDALVHWQRHVGTSGLPPYDDTALRRELDLFPHWCVEREYGLRWSDEQTAAWHRVCDQLVHSALAQPKVAVHRDWMPRNLMVAQPNPGILDFQDAVVGPIGYDVASMLRDAFISWDEEREIDWALRWWQGARKAGLLTRHPMGEDFGECWRAIEWIGLQRHLKVLGIFCRLKHRDGKPRYSADLARFFGYALRVATRYSPLAPLVPLLEPMSGRAVPPAATI